jgi:hypothetical protein
VPLYNLMEDAATVEISRSIAWQWIHHGAVLDDGKPLTVERFRAVLGEEMDRIRLEVGDDRFLNGRFEDSRTLFERMSTQPQFVEFITLPAYDLLEAEGEDRARILAGGSAVAGDSPAPAHPDPRRWEGIVRRYVRRRSRSSAARCASSTRSRSSGHSASGSSSTRNRTSPRSARSPATRPCRW